MFLKRRTNARDPLGVAMSGVRLGERVLQVGVDDAKLLGQIAAKVGLSGTAACVVTDEAAAHHARAGANKVGVLVDVAVASSVTGSLPHSDAAFDVVVVHAAAGLLSGLSTSDRGTLLRECGRVLRTGGRIVVVEAGARDGLASLLKGTSAAQASYDTGGGTLAALQEAGFAPVRPLGDREGLKFSEGLKTK
jgi:SAM-dependent methyltransferase